MARLGPITWLDFRSGDLTRARDFIKSLQDEGLLDELGFLALFGRFADIFYPATSTVMRSSRYLYFVAGKDLVRLLNDVERIASERSEELLSVKKELELLMALVRAYVPGNKRAPSRVFQAVQALVYLRDPYDAVLDQHVGLGLEDDVDRIRIAASPLIASRRAQRIPA